MLKRTARDLVSRFGITFYRLPPEQVLPLDYPVRAHARWGHGKPTHPGMTALLKRDRAAFKEVLAEIAARTDLFASISHKPDPASPARPHWDNTWFPPLDAVALMNFLLSRAPATYLEIGSGNSTKFARHAIDFGGLKTKLISIDPRPREEIDGICDDIIRRPLQECGAEIFGALRPGDILFFDGSHRIFTDSDVTAFFLDILPSVPKGVLVHIHDIFWPADYPPEWAKRFYSEQYILAVALLAPQPALRTVLPGYHVATDAELRAIVSSVPSVGTETMAEWVKHSGMTVPASSYWLETC